MLLGLHSWSHMRDEICLDTFVGLLYSTEVSNIESNGMPANAHMPSSHAIIGNQILQKVTKLQKFTAPPILDRFPSN